MDMSLVKVDSQLKFQLKSSAISIISRIFTYKLNPDPLFYTTNSQIYSRIKLTQSSKITTYKKFI